MIEILPKLVKTDVTCVKSYNNCILAAIGNTVQIYTKVGEQLQTIKVFNGQKVHGIIPNESNKIAFFGGNQLKLFEFDFLVTQITNEVAHRQCEDWIFDLQWVDYSQSVATIFAHNFISLWNVSNLTLAKRVGCTQKCILYSAKLINDTWNNLYAFSGTVFGQILIWNPASANCNFADVLYRLDGHDGAIFSIDYSSLIIATTSDDRTVRIWQTSDDIFSDNTTKPNSTITLKHTLYGHTARIFKCKIFRKFIVTAGEDSFVSIWNLNGKLVRKFETHQGGCVWALDMCPDILYDSIFTGGGDSGVCVFPGELKFKDYLLDIPKDVPKVLKLTANGNAVIVMTDGSFKYFNKQLNKLSLIHTYEGFKSYVVMGVAVTRNLIALAGLDGAIYIYKESPSDLIEFICDYKPDGNRIFALHWLSSTMFLTSTIDGLMNCWTIENNDEQYKLVKMQYKFTLPQCKERWATCAALCENSKLIVGDRKGNIHFYEFEKMPSIHTIKKAHCHLGVTYLYKIGEQLYSLGRNGMLNKYCVNDKSLTQVSSDKLPFSWIASMETIDDTIFLYGFSGTNFIVYNLNQRRVILTVFCGGGHRSWDCMVTKSKLFYFDYIRDKQVHVYSSKWPHLTKSNIIDGYHTKEINCSVLLEFKNNKLVVLSGGEDTTIRLALIDESYKFNALQTIKSHLSSVRCIAYCLLHKNTREHKYFVFTGGGRAQIIFHELNFDLVHDKIDCQQIYSYYKTLNDSDSETRIMDLVTISLMENIILIAGCSDGTLKCFRINIQEKSFEFFTEIKYKYKCIIRLAYINICNKHVVVSMATDGKLVFWDIDQICSKTFNINTPIKPFFELKTHQSGINSFDYRKLTNEKYIFASGGDDNAIVLTAINFNTTLEVDVLKQIKICDVHAAQITGLFLTEKYLISTSIDQNISVFVYDIQEKRINYTLLKQYNSSISDIQGMKCIEGVEFLVMVYGKGVEICSIKL